MRQLLSKIGQKWSVVIITVVSITLSLLITFSISLLANETLDQVTIIAATVAPAIIAPTVSWYFMVLLFRIHHLEEEQRKFATFDYLTGLMSRRAFFDNSTSLIHQCTKDSLELVVAIMDIDNFKQINDRYGHAGGDAVLKSFSALLSSITRPSDLVGRLEDHDLIGRLGGEEFAITMIGIQPESAVKVLERIRSAIAQDNVMYGGEKITYTVSMGVSKLNLSADKCIDDIINRADKALYHAKFNGKNRIEINYQWH